MSFKTTKAAELKIKLTPTTKEQGDNFYPEWPAGADFIIVRQKKGLGGLNKDCLAFIRREDATPNCVEAYAFVTLAK